MNEEDDDSVCLTPHSLASQSPCFLKIKNYNRGSVYCRPTHIHGGVLILTRDTLECEEICGIKELSVEIIVEMVAVRIPEKNIAILALNRVPSGELSDALQIITSLEKCNIILTGDCNVDFIEDSGNRNQLLNMIESFGLHIPTTERTPLD
ncbi:hypothetical protein HHI36_009200 [Cryptolaemus montrouzieri]|uniref:Endonuclease/exonuclease/phosphatase domain-containing protein n=1 Tax=Cryptolaemus montrouzieri TaxID=559131 RepID=A0ABD2MVG3_9CUCU